MPAESKVTLKVNIIAEEGSAKVLKAKIEPALKLIVGKLEKLIRADPESETNCYRTFKFDGWTFHNGTMEDLSSFDTYNKNVMPLVFVIGKRHEGLRGVNKGNTCIFHWSPLCIASLPSNLNENGGSKLTRDELAALSLFSAYVIHELLHGLGAFHAKHGLMSGIKNLENINDPDYSLFFDIDLMTQKTVRELMFTPSFNNSEVRVYYNHIDYTINVSANIPLLLYVFVHNGTYTRNFNTYPFTANKKEVKIRTPMDSWDLLVLVFRGEVHSIPYDIDLRNLGMKINSKKFG